MQNVMLVILFLFSCATDVAVSFKIKVQLHRLIHIDNGQTFSPSYSQSNNLCGSGSGRIFVLPYPQKKDRFKFHIPGSNIIVKRKKSSRLFGNIRERNSCFEIVDLRN